MSIQNCGQGWKSFAINEWAEKLIFLQIYKIFPLIKSSNDTIITIHISGNKLTPVAPGAHTRGFTKFMPFTEMKKVITEDNWLKVEAHLTFLNKEDEVSFFPQNINTVDIKEVSSEPLNADV